ncbi:D-sedoheptulose 7-phosphate isomerase [Paenibacillus qinlingensis]|uniref:Phosphoheptose isomerase n=1 Tax=Paenibacillus qinlingensis TaxID=1837343 RepID=A0ABU1NSU6_9BACL|nr:D-sedoheptulose 7-phosphate isomerase [Paenibacillus qinlingensis]MDR6550556.1 D-sedoheptulose 7-phosphate isomerase [Paenibacillus qinlingensis]
MKAYITSEILRAMEIKRVMASDRAILNVIERTARKMIEVYRNGNKIMIGGNGGSAADAQHIAGEFVSRFYFDRPGLPCIALTTDTSVLTAIGNDYGYEQLFARQIQACGRSGDLFIALSTSGNSPNVIKGLEMCRAMGITTIGFTGETGGRMAALCDMCICIPSHETPRIQEAHILVGHILCAIVEESLFGKGF